MKRGLRSIALAGILLSLMGAGHIAWASGGNNAIQYVGLHRQDCSMTGTGPEVGTARFSLDDQGGEAINPNGIEIRTAVTSGLARSTYSLSLLSSSCGVVATIGTLKTDDSGRGDLDVHVPGSMVPSGGGLRVQLVAPSNADIITSDPTSTD
jgi:hypothetical protein